MLHIEFWIFVHIFSIIIYLHFVKIKFQKLVIYLICYFISWLRFAFNLIHYSFTWTFPHLAWFFSLNKISTSALNIQYHDTLLCFWSSCYNYFLSHTIKTWANIHSCRVAGRYRLSSSISRFSTDIGSKIEAKKKRTPSLCGTNATPTVTNIDIALPTRDISQCIFDSLFTLRVRSFRNSLHYTFNHAVFILTAESSSVPTLDTMSITIGES